ncbi:PRTRC system protein C [Ralstonia mannitolilytica]|uniref:PRTRC system protein C n=1 Tax=Ralstonia mannitolilytica TaxID=105219 RepID=UPI0028F52242|nr:PRTRC system protein C [Ralstonia mannitolilytica]CAJ0740877.1 hypothetical protein R76696_03185 [Ralstonia mannitolilytica]
MEAIQLHREFRYNGVRLADPSPNFTLEQVRDFYANTYPEILNADIEGPAIEGAQQVYTFRRAVGTKGNNLADATLKAQIANGTLYKDNDAALHPGSLNHRAARVLLHATRRYYDGNTNARGAALVPPSTALQVLA